MVGRMLTFTSVGVAGSAAQATVLHFRAVLFNVSDNGWCHTFISLAENFRMHGGMVAIATRPPFLARVIALMVQVVVYFQMLAVYMVAPSVANAYLSYLAEEQVKTIRKYALAVIFLALIIKQCCNAKGTKGCSLPTRSSFCILVCLQVANLSRTMDMIDRGRAPWLSSLPAPALARSYYGLGMGREGATMREVFLRMRADSACNQHMTLVFSELCPAERNPFIVAADIKAQ